MKYGDTVKKIMKRDLGEARFDEICNQFSLSQEDRELMDRLWSELKLNYAMDDIVTLCKKYRDYPNIGRVMQAWELISTEAARVSILKREGSNCEQY